MTTDMTAAEYRARYGSERRSKYGNTRAGEFDSQAEARRWGELRLLEQAGAITNLRVHPRYVLQEAFTTYRGEHIRAITYIADFEYRERGRLVCEDVKGGTATQTQVFRLKAKMLAFRYPELELRIIER